MPDKAKFSKYLLKPYNTLRLFTTVSFQYILFFILSCTLISIISDQFIQTATRPIEQMIDQPIYAS